MACNALSCLKQDDLTLMAEQAQALKLLFEGRDVFVWFPTGYGKSIDSRGEGLETSQVTNVLP